MKTKQKIKNPIAEPYIGAVLTSRPVLFLTAVGLQQFDTIGCPRLLLYSPGGYHRLPSASIPSCSQEAHKGGREKMAFEVWEKMECEDEAADKSVAEFKRDQKKRVHCFISGTLVFSAFNAN